MFQIKKIKPSHWIILGGWVLFFCLLSCVLAFPAFASGNNAQFISQSVPASMATGQTYSVSFTFKNTGNTAWTKSTNYCLGSQNPQDNGTWGLGRVELASGDSIAPGQTKTFTFNVIAPAQAGAYNFQWRMLEEMVEWFGGFSQNVSVKVTLPTPINNAQFISQFVPTTMTTGKTYSVSFTFKNTGNTAWTKSTNYCLGSQNPQDNGTWGLGRVELASGDSIAPGQTKTFAFNVKAPAQAGAYNLQWRMLEEMVEWFGEFSQNMPIKVTSPQPDIAEIKIVQSEPNLTLGSPIRIKLEVANRGSNTWAQDVFHLRPHAYLVDGSYINDVDGNGYILPYPVKPEDTVTMNLEIPTGLQTQLNKTGQTQLILDMVHEGVRWFGNEARQEINIKPGNNAKFISQEVPAQLLVNQSYSVKITMENTGTTAWTQAGNYRLGPRYYDNGLVNGSDRGYLEANESIGPGQRKTFVLTVKAPAQPGAYNFQWRMLQEMVGLFGEFSQNVGVKVVEEPPKIISINLPDGSTFYENNSILISPMLNKTGSIEYQFSIDGAIKQDWSQQSSYSWTATGGIHTITVEVRDIVGQDAKQIEVCVFRIAIVSPSL